MHQPYQHNQYDSQAQFNNQALPNSNEYMHQFNMTQQHPPKAPIYANSFNQQQQISSYQDEEPENAIEQERDNQFQDQCQPMKPFSQNCFDFASSRYTIQQQPSSSNLVNGSASTLNLVSQQQPQSLKELEESKCHSSDLAKFCSKKQQIIEGEYICGKQFKAQQDMLFQQAQNNVILPLEKQEESSQNQLEDSEEHKGEKKISPLRQFKKAISKDKKSVVAFSQCSIKQNSSNQLSHHSSQSHSTSSSVSRDSFSSQSSSSSLQNQQEYEQHESQQSNTAFNYSLVPLSKNVQNKVSISGFGDCHVELNVERDFTADNRFVAFKYWRPCQNYAIDQNSLISRFYVEPNFNTRTSDFSSCIQIYKNYPDQNIRRWGQVLDMYQKWTSILYNEADYFYKKLNANPQLKQYFEEKMEIFMNEALKRVNQYLLDEQGSSKKQLFCYSLRKLNEEYKDIGSIQYGYSKGLIDILGPDPSETRLYLQRYGLNYFFDQKTRIERYIHDFQYIQQGGQIYDTVNVITLDKIQIELKVSNQYIYYDFFQDPLAKEVFGDFSECARLVRKFAGCKMEIFEIDPLQQQKLQVERHIYKPIYEKEKYLTFDDQLLSLYYKNEVKKITQAKNNKKQSKSSMQDNQIIEINQNPQQVDTNFEEFGYNPFENYMSFEKKEEDNQAFLLSDEHQEY
ncbi:hypothetical protein TTHERM_00102810 (macronuclear) [Tetrahymena thermophila SB210]|uniref:Uncharacterized protein n=1 Tax=Tetrahymena thermophila (strain SB210) TaxID=312017 RepID=Q234L7_TETTS|nr:hypothetical protein TTHERM_00102810 [Tetrahymena thermophila SB210]EAR91986.2 hypothetical protein TTHERM_00102810 [Tetrahymena thermophila SB210]|eukprot:XP_001012231.2 hypothetical protein TTHERM_00102810 [Tetrahymena thermophila SB210]